LVGTGAARYPIGGWDAPLGIVLTADGLSLLMLLMTAAVGLAVSLYAPGYFRGKTRQLADFWPLWLFLWAGLNGLYLSGDLFNLYVTLELVGLASVALAALAGGADALTGAMRYLLVSLVASLFYLLGVVLLYHGYGSLDIVFLAELVTPSPPLWAALGLITAGLLLKTALFPLHFWLPPAHASAAAPVSALLSALVRPRRSAPPLPGTGLCRRSCPGSRSRPRSCSAGSCCRWRVPRMRPASMVRRGA
jgi:formate hydrogenlyase subunit 3/multisubunit Na+/H+ antiporter MnhD subunit